MFIQNGLGAGISDITQSVIYFIGILLICYISFIISRKIILKMASKMTLKSKNNWDDVFYMKKVFHWFSHITPALIIYISAGLFIPYHSLIQRIGLSYMYVIGIFVLQSILDAIKDIYQGYEISKSRPIKGYIQVVQLSLFVMGSILIIATMMNRSPWVLLSSLGALMAIIILMFRDSILGFVAGVQLSGNDMVRLGDWIEMPKYRADGNVIDVSLNTIKVQNWDKTITSIPTYAFVSDSFKNWRGMQESGGRRIKRSLFIDMTSIKFCTEEMIERYERIEYISEYIYRKREEIENYNYKKLVDTTQMANGRRLTNIGTFRAYLQSYLVNHPKINKDMTLLVRQLTPTEHGLPIEIYVFTNDCVWANYEEIQADIFDHILTVVSEFDLLVFQSPTGHDLQNCFETDFQDEKYLIQRNS